MASMTHGEASEECGCGGFGSAWGAEGREGPGEEPHGGTAERQRAESSGGQVVEKEILKKRLRMRERSRILELMSTQSSFWSRTYSILSGRVT